MQRIFFIIIMLFAILVPSMLGYVKKSKEVSARAQSRIDYYEEYGYYDYD